MLDAKIVGKVIQKYREEKGLVGLQRRQSLHLRKGGDHAPV